jgi:hypothetical protein
VIAYGGVPMRARSRPSTKRGVRRQHMDATVSRRPSGPRFNVYLAPSPNPASHPEDVDGDVDVVFHFRTGATGIDQRDTEACLTGTTEHGVLITASDRVTVRRP